MKQYQREYREKKKQELKLARLKAYSDRSPEQREKRKHYYKD